MDDSEQYQISRSRFLDFQCLLKKLMQIYDLPILNDKNKNHEINKQPFDSINITNMFDKS